MIRFDSVSKKYAGTTRPALNGIALEVLRGEFVFLVGASGSGKSSCLRLILKEEKPTTGTIHVLGQDLGAISSRKVPYFRRNIGVVFQDFRLLPNKTVFENVAFTLQVIGKSRGFIQEAVPDVLTMVGLSGKAGRLPHELSGGEQQRVAIARAVVNKPQILLADEPTGNLDPATSAGIMAVLEQINAGGTTVIMATHEAGIVDQMQRRVIELVSGEIVRDQRHGGYGYTAAVPLPGLGPVTVPQTGPIPVHVAVEPEPIPEPEALSTSQPEPASVATDAEVHPTPPAPASVGAGDTGSPATGPNATGPSATAPSATGPSATGSTETGSTDTGPTRRQVQRRERDSTDTQPNRIRDHFAAPITQPILRTTPLSEDDLPDQLGLAEKLGLRDAHSGEDPDDQQAVGPTK